MPKHSLDYNNAVCDLVLNMFDNMPDGYISAKQLYGGGKPIPADQNEVLSFLVAEGLLEQVQGGYKITYKGRMKAHQGGFRKAQRKDAVVRFCTIVAAITGCIAIILQVLSWIIG
ncbi:MAG: hypothetical protein IJM41_00665 [Bacteroidales bacterium]|nr:hypothetical protein [Bacteroidales bacterium]